MSASDTGPLLSPPFSRDNSRAMTSALLSCLSRPNVDLGLDDYASRLPTMQTLFRARKRLN